MTMADVGKEYGRALFELAEEEALDMALVEEIRTLEKILKENPDLIKLLDAPNINLEERINVIDTVFADRVHKYLCSFMKLLTEKRYFQEIFDCFIEYKNCIEEKNSIIEAHVTSAAPLSEEQKDALYSKLTKKANKKIIVKYEVDPELLGGIRVNMDGELFEGTIKARLHELRSNLKKETL